MHMEYFLPKKRYVRNRGATNASTNVPIESMPTMTAMLVYGRPRDRFEMQDL
jgi:hypothetical protein